MGPRNGMRPVHPREVLRDELDTLGLSANALSNALGVPGEPGHDDSERPTGCDGGHGTAACAILRDAAATLVEPAKDLGASPRGDRGGRPDCQADEAPANGSVTIAKESQCLSLILNR